MARLLRQSEKGIFVSFKALRTSFLVTEKGIGRLLMRWQKTALSHFLSLIGLSLIGFLGVTFHHFDSATRRSAIGESFSVVFSSLTRASEKPIGLWYFLCGTSGRLKAKVLTPIEEDILKLLERRSRGLGKGDEEEGTTKEERALTEDVENTNPLASPVA
jgi:hypothetical protein